MNIGEVVFLRKEKKFAIIIDQHSLAIKQNDLIELNNSNLVNISFKNNIINTIKSFAKNGIINNNYYHLSSAFDLLRKLNIEVTSYLSTNGK